MRLHAIKYHSVDQEKSDLVGPALIYVLTIVLMIIFFVCSFNLDTTLNILKKT